MVQQQILKLMATKTTKKHINEGVIASYDNLNICRKWVEANDEVVLPNKEKRALKDSRKKDQKALYMFVQWVTWSTFENNLTSQNSKRHTGDLTKIIRGCQQKKKGAAPSATWRVRKYKDQEFWNIGKYVTCLKIMACEMKRIGESLDYIYWGVKDGELSPHGFVLGISQIVLTAYILDLCPSELKG